jgi:uncharacterized protein YceK
MSTKSKDDLRNVAKFHILTKTKQSCNQETEMKRVILLAALCQLLMSGCASEWKDKADTDSQSGSDSVMENDSVTEDGPGSTRDTNSATSIETENSTEMPIDTGFILRPKGHSLGLKCRI